MPNPYAIDMKNIAFSYGDKNILSDFNLCIEKGKTYCLVGSSGSGKTTTLRLMNGLLQPNDGEIFIEDKKFDFSKGEQWRRQMGYSIQGSGLFPHMTLYENLSIIARKENWQKSQINQRIQELCELMDLPYSKDFLNKKPRQISGGQQQRVGIARALFMNPQIMLMDEPFSALDPITRAEIQKEFLSLQSKLHLTIVLVTHDLPEAFKMADEIVLLNQGKIEQKGRPSKFLLSPATKFVESFIHSHSPGNILKEVFLYSVLNTSVFSTFENPKGFEVCDIETNECKSFSSLNEVDSFLQSQKQRYHYFVDKDRMLLKSQEVGKNSHELKLQSTDNILHGMQKILDAKESALPVVNDKGQLMGVFSQEALSAL